MNAEKLARYSDAYAYLATLLKPISKLERREITISQEMDVEGVITYPLHIGDGAGPSRAYWGNSLLDALSMAVQGREL